MNLLIKVKPDDNLFLIKKIILKILKKFNTYSEFRLIKTNVDVDPYNYIIIFFGSLDLKSIFALEIYESLRIYFYIKSSII